jgi:hypothetical protein
MVGGEPAVSTEFTAAVLAGERERDLVAAVIAARHASSFAFHRIKNSVFSIPVTQSLIVFRAGQVCMGQYTVGDVLLASVALDDRTPPKTRPVIVIGMEESGLIRICPVSSKPPSDAPCLPLTIDDFAAGGLDLFSESYIMTSRVLTLRSGAVIGKKGRLNKEALAEITARVPSSANHGTDPKKQSTPGKSQKIR